jgi:RND family efflux transporter MFP subunit
MTTRSIAGLAAGLLAAAGVCVGATSDNPGSTPADSSPAVGAPAVGAPAWDTLSAQFGGSKADTHPSRDVTMQFPQSMQVREINAVGGQKVKKGEKLILARDAEIVAAIVQQKDKSVNDLEIQGSKKQWELAEFKFGQIKASKTFSPQEFEEARIAAETAQVQYEQAQKNKVQEELKVKQLEGQYERYWLEAPFDGIIEEIMVEVGQGCTEQEKVLRMVNTDKLWLDPYAETYETIRLKLKEGSPAWVLIDMPDAPKLVTGKVLYVSPVADSVSQTRRVRVEIDNPEGWPAGTQARVRFTEPSGDWQKYKAQAASAGGAMPSDDVRQLVVDLLNDAEARAALMGDVDTAHTCEPEMELVSVPNAYFGQPSVPGLDTFRYDLVLRPKLGAIK